MTSVMIPVLLFLMLTCPTSGQGLEFREKNGEIQLWEGDRHVFGYQTETKSIDGKYPRANYVHPINDFQGHPLTEDFPADHLHHRGVFWSWHQLYAKGNSLADPWECRDIEWLVRTVTTELKEQEQSALMKAEVIWRVGTEKQEVMKEQLTITYRGFDDHFTLDFSIDFISLSDLELGGSPDEKGYGGFSARFLLGNDVRFFGKAGEVMPKNTAVSAGEWMKISGVGKNNSEVVIMYHRASTAKCRGWIIRKSGSMQNPLWPGSERVAFNKGEAFSLQTRLMIFRSRTPSLLETERLNQIFQESSRSK